MQESKTMKKIEMVDLGAQYSAIKGEIREAIDEVLESAIFIGGPVVQRFQKNLEAYLGVKHVIPCANGTDALQIALMAIDAQPGDEIIIPSFTYIATTEVIALLKLTPVFVDVDPVSYCVDPKEIEKAITSKTKAIVPVHLYGQVADMNAIMAIAEKHKLYVIEDNAQAIGADYTLTNGQTKKAGTIAHIGCTSFFPSKNLGCYGDGGAMCTNDDALAEKLRMIANHGQRKKYHHEIVGCNSRLDAIQAAVLNVKLPRLDQYVAARQKVADYYDQAFAGCEAIKTPVRVAGGTHVFHQYTVQLNGIDRDELKNYLAEKGIPTMIYYPQPAHLQPMFSAFNLEDLSLPVTEQLTKNVISFPIHTEMPDEHLAFITSEILTFCNK